MVGLGSTTLVIVGDDAPKQIDALNRLANVSAATFTGAEDEDVRRWVSSSHLPYVVHDHDPLSHVAAAWVEFFDDQTTLGTLDFEIDRALTALERGLAAMPDYYVVLEPETLSPTWKHWWLGVLPEAAPTRVIPWDDRSPSVARMLRKLPTGRAWPEPEPWLRTVARSVPDRVGLER